MVLGILESIYRSSYFPRSYVPHILLTSLAVVILHALSQGRKTSRDRDLHARTVILTGAFTSSLGITLLQDLAKRGARVIALSPYKADDPQITILVSLLRTTTGNEEVFAEECDLDDAGEVRKFCTRFLTGGQLPDSEKKEKGKEAAKDEPPPPPGSAPPPGQGSSTDQRLDAIVFAHEYPHVGAISPFRTRSSFEEEAKHRERGSLASFLMTTLLLPSLLVAPVDRDIRIVNVVNPFYAAASGPSFHNTYPASFSSSPSSSPSSLAASKPTPVTGDKPKKRSKPSVFLEEGIRSLRSVILTRHLQRVLDALPAPQAPSTAGTQATVVNPKMQKSNIVAVSVSPGVSRMDTVAPMVNANWGIGEGKPSIIGIILYLLLQPILRIFTKSPSSAVQTVLHALFLPTPFKSLSMRIAEQEATSASTSSSTQGKEDKSDSAGEKTTSSSSSSSSTPSTKLKKPQAVFREVLKPGALYSDCAVVVTLKVPPPPPSPASGDSKDGKKAAGSEKKKSDSKKDKGKAKEKGEELDISIEDDGDYGGEAVGRVVWEAYEGALKLWEGKPGQTVGAGAGAGKSGKSEKKATPGS